MDTDETIDVAEDSLEESPFEDEQEHSINRRSLSLVSISAFLLVIVYPMENGPWTIHKTQG